MEQKYYIGLGIKGSEKGWVYKERSIINEDLILEEEFTINGSLALYSKDGVAEITKEEYYSIIDELKKEDFNGQLIINRTEKILERVDKKNKIKLPT